MATVLDERNETRLTEAAATSSSLATTKVGPRAKMPRFAPVSRPILVAVVLISATFSPYFLLDIAPARVILSDLPPSSDKSLNREKIDFGSAISEGRSVEIVVPVTNSGPADFIVTEVRSSCGCADAKLAAELIRQNSTSDLKVMFDSNLQVSPFLPERHVAVDIFIHGRYVGNPSLISRRLSITGVLIHPISINGEIEVVVSAPEDAEVASGAFPMQIRGNVEVRHVSGSCSDIQCSRSPDSPEVVTLRLTNLRRLMSLPDSVRSMRVDAVGPGGQFLAVIPIRLKVLKALRFDPESIFMGPLDTGDAATARATLTSGVFRIMKIEQLVDAASRSIDVHTACVEQSAEITLAFNATTPGFRQFELAFNITVENSDSNQSTKVVRLPVRVFTRTEAISD